MSVSRSIHSYNLIRWSLQGTQTDKNDKKTVSFNVLQFIMLKNETKKIYSIVCEKENFGN